MEKSKLGRTVMEVGADGVSIITIVNPPLNLLSVEVVLSLKESCGQALRRDDVKAIVITGAKGKFSGGFDVTAFGGQLKTTSRRDIGYLSIEFITDFLEASIKPVVAAVDGPAMGGALEIAMACHARISTSTAQLGLTELRYGLIPGFGGTQRLPRLVGVRKSLDMMLHSKLVKGEEALALGLVDAIVPAVDLLHFARCWALDIAERKKPWIVSLYKTVKLEPLAEVKEMLKIARDKARKENPNLTHLLICIDVIEEGLVSGPRKALLKEAQALHELRQSNICKSLVHFFFSRYRTSKVPGVTNLGLVPKKVNKVGVVGGGLMGSGIATALILNNYTVFLKEVDPEFLMAAIDRVKLNLQSCLSKGEITQKKLEESLSLCKGVLSYKSFRDVDLVIEAITENIVLKQQVFVDIEKSCSKNCIFATSTSTLDLKSIIERTRSQNQIIGTHFFSPPHVMPLLEVVRTENTHPQIIVDILDFAKKIQKTAIVTGSCPGFAVNRMFFPYTQAAMLLVERGADVYQIDQAISKFGMPMGPFRMVDLVGFTEALSTEALYIESYPERSYKSTLIPILQANGRAGKTAKKGFYVYDENDQASPDPELKRHVNIARRKSDVPVDSQSGTQILKLNEDNIIEMLLFPVVNEACRLLAEGIASKSSDLDIASVMGKGFPSYRGGIIFWANSIGPSYIRSKLETWATMHGVFFKPCRYLVERASAGIPLGMELEPTKPSL